MSYNSVWGSLAAFSAGGGLAAYAVYPVPWTVFMFYTICFTILAFTPFDKWM